MHVIASGAFDLLHYGHLLLFEGPSYRMTHALMAQKG